jgi:filamentous hemagglutinin family protein
LASALAVGGAIASGDCGLAQIIPDTTLGSENSKVTSTGSVDQIKGGATRGTNLFHSFQEFNVNEGRGAYFTNPAGIENILSRVTGGNRSNILGKLGVLGNANLFLMNPNGIIFGPNSSLDVRGSFVASTANRFTFPDGSEFSATKPGAPPLLTINVPIGLQYGTQPAGDIISAGNLSTGQDLTLAGNNLDLKGQLQVGRDLQLQAHDTLRIRDSVTHPFIASAGGQMVLQGNQVVDIFALNHPHSGFYSGGDMTSRSANTVGGDAHFNSGGSFRIEQLDGKLGNLFSPHDPIVRASGDVSFNSYSGASLHILAGGSVTITGDVTITGADTTGNALVENVQLSNSRTVAIDGTAQPTLDIRAGTTAVGTPGIAGEAEELSSVSEIAGQGTNANITISGTIRNPGGLISLTNLYQPNPALVGGAITTQEINTGTSTPDSNGGDIAINARNSINTGNLYSYSLFSSTVGSSTSGDGGAISLFATDGDITTEDLFSYSYSDSASFPSSLASSGDGGAISLHAANGGISITGDVYSSSDAFSSSLASSGDGGAISLHAANGGINIMEGLFSYSRSDSASSTSGNGGAISLYADNGDIITQSIYSSSTSVSSSLTESSIAGDGGAISLRTVNGDITTQNLHSQSESSFDSASSFPTGDAISGDGGAINLYAANGNITTEFLDSSTFSDSSPYFPSASSFPTGDAIAGNGGAISLYADGGITTRSLSSESTAISASSSLTGNAISGNGGAISLSTGNEGITVRGYLFSRSISNSSPFRSASSFPTGDAISGDGGAINLYAANGNINISDEVLSTVDSSTSASSNSFSSSSPTGDAIAGNGGAINLYAANGSVNTGDLDSYSVSSSISYSTSTPPASASASPTGDSTAGNGGAINVHATNGGITTGDIISNSISNSISYSAFASASPTGDSSAGNGGVIDLHTVGGNIITENLRSYSSSSADSVSASPTGDTTAKDGGTIQLYAPNGGIAAGNLRSFSEAGRTASGGSVSFHALGDVITSSINTTSQSGSGNITLTTNEDVSFRQLELNNTSRGRENAPTDRGVTLTSDTFGAGAGGDIQITARSISLINGSQISASSHSSGRGGNITLRASDAIELSGISPNNEAPGNLFAPAGLTGIPEGTFLGGYIPTGNADDLVSNTPSNTVYPSGVFTQTTTESTGNAGNLIIDAGRLIVRDGATIATTTFGQGRAGDISVEADSISATNGSMLSGVAGGAKGDSGMIELQSRSLSITEGGLVQTQTLGEGDAGTIQVNASDEVSLTGIGSSLRSGSGGSNELLGTVGSNVGQGGDIKLTTSNLRIVDGATLDAQTQSDRSGVEGANITLQDLDLLLMRNRGQITARAFGDDNGGNITIDTNNLVALEDSDITANAFEGRGGEVRINTQGDFRSPDSDITASSDLGIDGVVELNTPDVDPSSGLVSLPVVPVETEVVQACTPGGTGTESEFVVTGRGGLPSNPSKVLSSDAIEVDWVTLTPKKGDGSSPAVSVSPVVPESASGVEAQGWIVNRDGEVVLTASANSAQPRSSEPPPAECHTPQLAPRGR